MSSYPRTSPPPPVYRPAARQGAARPYPQPAGAARPAVRIPAPAARRQPLLRVQTLVWLGLAACAALLLLAGALALGGFAYFQVGQRILPGVSVGNQDLGGQSVFEAAVALHKSWNLEHRILVSNGIRSGTVAPETLGLSVDALQTAQAAYEVGHNQPVPAEGVQMLYSLSRGWEIVPQVRFDPAKARLGLEALSAQMSQAPQDASLRLEGGQVVSLPAKVGYRLDVENTLATLAADPQAVLRSGSLKLALRPVAPQVSDVSAVRQEAERLLGTPVKIAAYDPLSDEQIGWTIPAGTVAGWLKVEPGQAGPQLSLDPERVKETLDGLSAALDGGRWLDTVQAAGPVAQAVRLGKTATVILRHKPTTYTVQAGDTLLKIGWKVGIPYWRVARANPGLDADALTAGQELVIPSKDDLLPLPVVPDKRIRISISEQRMRIFQDGQQVNEYVISTGIDRSPTQPGIFQVQTHEINAYASVWDLTMPHFMGIYEAWPGFMNGIHGLPMLSNGRRLWANILGKPASYGCIILDLKAAEDLYQWAENGVVVEITP